MKPPTPHHHAPCYAPTHARCGLPVIPEPQISHHDLYPVGQHDTAATRKLVEIHNMCLAEHMKNMGLCLNINKNPFYNNDQI